MIEWGQKSKPKKIPEPILNPPRNPIPNFRAIKISRGTMRVRGRMRRGNYHESWDCFEYPKKSLLKSSYPKNTYQKFPTKKSRNRKFQTLKHPSIVTVTWNPEIPPPPTLRAQALFVKSASEIRDLSKTSCNEDAVIEWFRIRFLSLSLLFRFSTLIIFPQEPIYQLLSFYTFDLIIQSIIS